MSDDVCRLEPDVVQASVNDRWTDSLRRHIGECPDCAAAADISAWMQKFAMVPDREHMLPDPQVLRLKAILLRQSVAAERAARPLNILQVFAYGVVAAGWAAMLTWKWSALEQWIASLSPSAMVGAAAGQGAAISASFLMSVILLASMTVVLAMHTIIADD